MTDSRAGIFFKDQISDFASLEALIGQEENEWLEFKGADCFDSPSSKGSAEEKKHDESLFGAKT